MIFHSPYPDVEIPNLPLATFVLAGAHQRAEKPALIDGPTGTTILYGQLADRVQSVAAGLVARGLRKGDVFAILAPNSPEFVVALLGVANAGGVVTAISPQASVDEIEHQLHDAGARFLLTAPALIDVALSAAHQVGIEEVFAFGDVRGATPFDALMETEARPPDVSIDPITDLVVMPYSSGTTGFPKGVMLTHQNVVANICQIGALHDIRESDILIGAVPFFHVLGMFFVVCQGLTRGAAIVTTPRFELPAFLQLLQDYRVTRAHVVPPIVKALAYQPIVEHYDLTSLDLVYSGGAPLDHQLADACGARLRCRVIQGYGLTEMTCGTHLSSDRPGQSKTGSVGQALPNTEVKLINPMTGRVIRAGQTGEVLVRGPQMMTGYLRQAEATAATIDADGWLHTGDIGFVDEAGSLFLVDRLKEMIKYKGYQVAPAELEAILTDHPAVADAAVIPKRHADAGEIPKAFVVLRNPVSAQDLIRYVAAHVAPFKRVREVEFVDRIPRSPSGKILRRRLVVQERALGVVAGEEAEGIDNTMRPPRHNGVEAGVSDAPVRSPYKTR